MIAFHTFLVKQSQESLPLNETNSADGYLCGGIGASRQYAPIFLAVSPRGLNPGHSCE